jgi:uncharacterized protein (DUF2164 family)
MAITLKQDVETAVLTSLQRYFSENMDEKIGNLQARNLLDFVLKEIGPSIYNQAISDAQRHMLAKVSDLDVDCYQAELGYWTKKK